MAERVSVREISNEEGQRLLRTVRRSSGSVVTWRRAQMVLLSAQGMAVPAIAEVTFTSPDRVRNVPQLQHRRVRFPQAQVRRRPATEVQPAPAPGDQKDRAGPPDRLRSAVLDLEPAETG